MTRRELLFCAGFGALAAWAVLWRTSVDPPRAAYVSFLVLLGAATLVWLAMLARNARKGFPLPLAYSRPISTPALVGVPMLYFALACALTYALPATLLRVVYGAPLPVVPVAVVLAAGATVFCVSGWAMSSSWLRSALTVALMLLLGAPVGWLKPWMEPAATAFPPPLRLDSVQLKPTDYVLIALVAAAAYAAAVGGVGRQRHGAAITPAAPAAAPTSRPTAAKGMVEHFRDIALKLVRVQCPTSSPLAAELWMEIKSRGLPVLAIGLAIAAVMPAMFWLGNRSGWVGALAFIGFGAALPFFAGISVSFWNRDSSLRAPMSGFEAARPATTAYLAAVQIGVAVASILAAWLLVGVSIWLSLPLFKGVVDFAPMQRALLGTLAQWSVVRIVAAAVAAITIFATFVALLAAVRALSARYGLRLWLGVVAIAAYLLAFAFFGAGRPWQAPAIGAHLWVLAVSIPVLTLAAAAYALVARALLPRQAAWIGAAWVVFAAALPLGFALDASTLAGLAPAVAAVALAAVLLPLTAAALAVWSLGRIRHV